LRSPPGHLEDVQPFKDFAHCFLCGLLCRLAHYRIENPLAVRLCGHVLIEDRRALAEALREPPDNLIVERPAALVACPHQLCAWSLGHPHLQLTFIRRLFLLRHDLPPRPPYHKPTRTAIDHLTPHWTITRMADLQRHWRYLVMDDCKTLT